LEDANIKLDSVVTDIIGMTGRAMLAALIAGETDPGKLAALAHPRIKAPPVYAGGIILIGAYQWLRSRKSCLVDRACPRLEIHGEEKDYGREDCEGPQAL
jgi:hypothetical protein